MRAAQQSSGASVASASTATSETAAMLSTRHRISLLGQKTGRRESFDDAEVVATAREALDLGSHKNIAACLNELLFARTPRGSPGSSVLRGPEGLRKLKRENKQERCGKIFREGDLAYNCLTCQVDSTCVICQDCFEESEHDGHEVTFHRTGPGGCCDCGDEEAWAPSGFCSRHGAHNLAKADHDVNADPRDSLPDGVLPQFEAILDAIFASVHDAFEEVFKSYAREFEATGLTVADDFATEPDTFNVVLNNDDIHSFDFVVDTLADLAPEVNLSPAMIDAKTEMVDKHGRAPIVQLRFASDEEMLRALQTMRRVRHKLDHAGLLVCISRGVQLVHERRAVAGLAWMLEMAQLSQGLSRCIIERFINPPQRDAIETLYAEAYMLARCGEEYYWPRHQNSSSEPLSAASDARLSIIHAALKYDALMPKQFARHMQGLWLGLLTHVDFKQTLGSALMAAHRSMSSAFSCGIGTRNETFNGLSVQLLTVPSVIQRIENEFRQRGRDLVVEALQTIKFFLWTCCTSQPEATTPGGPVVRSAELDVAHNEAIIHQRYVNAIIDARYILRLVKHPLVDAEDVAAFVRLESFFQAIAPTQRMNPQRRHQGREHVVQEFNDWIRAFKLSMNMQYVLRLAAQQVGVGLAAFQSLKPDARAEAPTLRDLVNQVGRMAFKHSFRWHLGEPVARPTCADSPSNLVVSSAKLDPLEVNLTVAGAGPDATSSLAHMGPFLAHELRFPLQPCENLDAACNRDQKLICKGSVFQGALVSHHLPVQRFFAAVVRALAVAVERQPSSALGVEGADLEQLLARAFPRVEKAASAPTVDFDQFGEDVLRVVATNAQVGAQLWRRTGMTMDNILTNYKGVCATSMYQSDVCFLQIMAASQGADNLVALLIEKFGLSPFLSPTSRMSAIKADSGADSGLHKYGQLLDELLRLLIHIATEIPVARIAGRAAVRREVVHALAASESNCTFSKVMDSVRAARISVSDAAQDLTGSDAEVTPGGPESAEVTEEGEWVSAGEVERMLDLVADRHGSSSAGSVSYSLKPDCWHEVDPLFWNVARQHEELVADRLCKAHQDAQRDSWPMAAPPPGPPVRILGLARCMAWTETLLRQVVAQVCLDMFCVPPVPVARLRASANGEQEGFATTKAQLPTERVALASNVSPGLMYTTLHMITLAMHTTEAVGVDKARALESTPLSWDLSLLEIIVNLEALFAGEGADEKAANLRWCSDQLALRHPQAVHALRVALMLPSSLPSHLRAPAGSGDRPTHLAVAPPTPGAAMSVDTPVPYEDVDMADALTDRNEDANRGQLSSAALDASASSVKYDYEADSDAGNKEKDSTTATTTAATKKKKKGKKKHKKKDRGLEAQKAAMARMEAAQARALEKMGGEGAFTEDAVHEENYCVLCHEHLQRKQYAFLGYVRRSAWGHVLPLMSDERCPPEVLSTPRKPAGWTRPGDQAPAAGENFLQDTGRVGREFARRFRLGRRHNQHQGEGQDQGAAESGAAGSTEVDMDWTLADNDRAADFAPGSENVDDEDDEFIGDGLDDGLDDDLEEMEDFAEEEEEVSEEDFLALFANRNAGVVAGQGAPAGLLAALNRATNLVNGLTAGMETGARRAEAETAAGNAGQDAATTDAEAGDGQGDNVHMAQRIQQVVTDMIREQQHHRPGRTLPAQQPAEDPRKVVPATKSDVYVGFCSHAMHMECLQTYIASLHNASNRLWPSNTFLPNVTEHEFLCPMCKSLSNVILPYVPETRAPVEKRRRVSSSAATPHEMVRFITGELGDVAQRDLSSKARKDIEIFADMLHKTHKALRLPEYTHALRASTTIPVNGNPERVLAIWRSIGFSLSARASVRQAGCGDSDEVTGFRELVERVDGSRKQWLSMLRAAGVLLQGWSESAASPGSALTETSQSQGTASASSLSNSFRATLRGFSSPSASPGDSQTPAFGAGTGAIATGRERSASLSEALGRSFLRSPLHMFLGSFGRRGQEADSGTSDNEAPSRPASGLGAGVKGPRDRDDVDGGTSGPSEALFEMLARGSTRRLGELGAGLAPGVRTRVALRYDESVATAVPIEVKRAAKVARADGSGTFDLAVGDRVVEVDLPNKVMIVEHEISPDGVLLNMGDPVTLAVALLSALPPPLYIRAVRAVAMATLVQGVLEAPATGLCGKSLDSRKFSVAQGWVSTLRRIAPQVTAEHVYYALYVKLARFLRASVLLLAICAEDKEASEFVELGEYVTDETEALWVHFLGLPSMGEMTDSSELMEIIDRWKSALGPRPTLAARPELMARPCCLAQTRLRLIKLPTNYEQLLKVVRRDAKCPTTGELVSRPALCLRCGVVVCGGDKCCARLTKTEAARPTLIGAGTLHAMSCGGGSGAFLLVQKCMVMLVHGMHVARISAPYVDSHGETDDYLQRGRPLRFHEPSFRNLQFICSNNEICNKVVSRLLMQDARQRYVPYDF